MGPCSGRRGPFGFTGRPPGQRVSHASPAWPPPGLWRLLPPAGRSASPEPRLLYMLLPLGAGVPETPSSLRNPNLLSTAADGPGPMVPLGILAPLWTEIHIELLHPWPVRLPPRQSQEPPVPAPSAHCAPHSLVGDSQVISQRERQGDLAAGDAQALVSETFHALRRSRS